MHDALQEEVLVAFCKIITNEPPRVPACERRASPLSPRRTSPLLHVSRARRMCLPTHLRPHASCTRMPMQRLTAPFGEVEPGLGS